MRPRTKYRIGAASFVAVLIFVATLGAFSGIQVCKYHCQPDTPDLRTADDRIADYTRGLEWLTAILAGVSLATLIFVVRADGTARRSADAALKAANALNLIERAYVLAKVKIEEVVHAGGSGDVFTLKVQFPNRGRTPAMVTQIRASHDISTDPPTQFREYPGSDRLLPQGLAIASDLMFDVRVRAPVPPQEMAEIENERKGLYCLGLIKYDDVLGQHRETGFCWQYHVRGPHRGSFQIAVDSKLNYFR